MKNVSDINRDYLSTELFLKNNSRYRYDSFIFGSSRGCGLNTYLWKYFLTKGVHQFLFQAWGETITGIYQKIEYLDKINQPIKNAIILIDIPGSFCDVQQPHEALAIKHYKLSDMNSARFQYYLFKSYLKPSEIAKSIQEYISDATTPATFDTLSNDWFIKNKTNWKEMPKPDLSLDKSKFKPHSKEEIFSAPLINNQYLSILDNIAQIFKKHHTSYKIIITPAYDQIHIHPIDQAKISRIFGFSNIYNFSGKNIYTENKYNFMDINHFDLNLGYIILNTCYKKRVQNLPTTQECQQQ